MYSGLRISKSQKPTSDLYNIFCGSVEDINDKDFTVMSVDPGIKNLALRVERRSQTISTLYFEKVNIKKDRVEGLMYEDFQFISDVLDKQRKLLEKCDLFVVERQLPQNYKAVRISQHIISYFICLVRSVKSNAVVLEINPKMKSKMLKAPPNLNENGVKKWSVEVGVQLLKDRRDKEGLKYLNTVKTKWDDLTDTILQVEAFCVNVRFPLTLKESYSDDEDSDDTPIPKRGSRSRASVKSESSTSRGTPKSESSTVKKSPGTVKKVVVKSSPDDRTFSTPSTPIRRFKKPLLDDNEIDKKYSYARSDSDGGTDSSDTDSDSDSSDTYSD